MNCSNLCFDLSFSNWRWLLTCRQNVTWWISKDLPTEYTSACTYRHLCTAPHFAMQMCDLQVQYGFLCVQEAWGRIWARALNSSPVLALISVTRGKSCFTASIPQHNALQNGGDNARGTMQCWRELEREAGSTPDTLSSAFPYGNVLPFLPGEVSPSQRGRERCRHSLWTSSFPKWCWPGFSPRCKPCGNKQGTESHQEQFPSLLKAGMETQNTEQIYKCLLWCWQPGGASASQETPLSQPRDLSERRRERSSRQT